MKGGQERKGEAELGRKMGGKGKEEGGWERRETGLSERKEKAQTEGEREGILN